MQYCYGFTVGGFGRVMSITVRNQFGFSHPTLDSQTLNIRHHSTTAVSRVITPAGSAQASGHAPRIAIPTYPWTLPVGEIDPGYRLVLSETERILPVCNHFGFYIQIERIVPRRGTNLFKVATSYESARFIGDIGEHDTSKAFTTML